MIVFLIVPESRVVDGVAFSPPPSRAVRLHVTVAHSLTRLLGPDRSVCGSGSKQCTFRSKDVCSARASDNTPPHPSRPHRHSPTYTLALTVTRVRFQFFVRARPRPDLDGVRHFNLPYVTHRSLMF